MNDADSCRCDDMAARILRFCEAHDVKIVAAESLTGGLLADAFVRVPGASRVFLGSAVTYDIRAKASILGVDRGLLEREGAVHPEVARQMAASVAGLYGQPEYADRVIGLSTTGVAGPGPDVGVRIPAAISPDGVPSVTAHELHLTGGREEVRRGAVFSLVQIVSHFTGDMQE